METPANSGLKTWKDNKFLAIFEIVAIAIFIFAQNIYKILPISEVPYLFLVGWIMLRFRSLKWNSIGLKKPESWLKTVIIGLLAGIFLQLISEFVTEPLINYFTQQPADLSAFRDLVGNPVLLLVYFVVIWTLAAFGEEFVYRGYIMNRMADVGNRTNFAWVVSLILVSVLFGVGHFYQGISGIIGSGISGLIFAGVYFYSGKNLWAAIFAHGFSDTIGLLIIYFGWAKI